MDLEAAKGTYEGLKRLVASVVGDQPKPAQPGQVLVIEDPTSGLQIVLEADLPTDAYRQLVGLDLSAIQQGPPTMTGSIPDGVLNSMSGDRARHRAESQGETRVNAWRAQVAKCAAKRALLEQYVAGCKACVAYDVPPQRHSCPLNAYQWAD